MCDTHSVYLHEWSLPHTTPLTNMDNDWIRTVYRSWIKPEVISCAAPRGVRPMAVSIVKSPCDTATNALKIIHPPGGIIVKSDFGVCGGAWHFTNDISTVVVEWVESLKLVGMDKVHVYIYTVHPNVTKVLDYYEETGFLEVTKISLPHRAPNTPGFINHFIYNHGWRKGQSGMDEYSLAKATMNDCIYKNMYNHKYIISLDVDEIVVPHKGDTVQSFFKVKMSHPLIICMRSLKLRL